MKKISTAIACLSLFVLSACGSGSTTKTCTFESDEGTVTTEFSAKGDDLEKVTMKRLMFFADGKTKKDVTDEQLEKFKSDYSGVKGVEVDADVNDKGVSITLTYTIDKLDKNTKKSMKEEGSLSLKKSVESLESSDYKCK